jgi:drug/metabolite transporter (DMT)-like permease
MCIGSVILMLIAGYNLNTSMLQAFIHQPFNMYVALIYMIIFGTVLSYLFWNYSISQLGAGKTSIFFNLIPVVTTMIAIFLGQTVTSVQIIGGVGVIFGVLLSTNVLKSPLGFLKLNRSTTYAG